MERCIEREKGKKEILIKMPYMPPTPPALQIRDKRRKSEEILQPHTTEVYSTPKTKKHLELVHFSHSWKLDGDEVKHERNYLRLLGP